MNRQRIIAHSAWIDPKKLDERVPKLPVDPWNWVEFENYWYPKMKNNSGDHRQQLRDANKEFGTNFTSHDELYAYMLRVCSFEVEEYICDICGSEFKTKQAYQNHKGSKACDDRRKRNEATQKGLIYLPDCLQKVHCKCCNKTLINRASYTRHLQSDEHNNNKQKQTALTTCLCGNEYSNETAFRRHLKTSAKCHKIARSSEENKAKWSSLYNALNCKFPSIFAEKARVLTV